MDQQTGVGFAIFNGVDDLVKRDDDVLKLVAVDAESQIGTRHFAGNGDLHVRNIRHVTRFAGDDDRAIIVADARAMRQQGIFVGNIRVRVKRYRRHVKNAILRVFV